MSRIFTIFLLTLSTFAVDAQEKFDVRGSAPFETTLAGAKYPQVGSIFLRCDAGLCNFQKVTFLCDRDNADLEQSNVTADRIKLVKTPSETSPHLEFKIEDFGTDYRCAFRLRQDLRSGDRTFHVDSFACDYLSAWHGNKTKVEQSVDQLDLKRQCKQIVLKKSQW